MLIPFLEKHSVLTPEEEKILADFKAKYPIHTFDDVKLEQPKPERSKIHQVITNAGYDGGIDDKPEYATVEEAVKEGKKYLDDDYLGFCVYNQETKMIEHIEGDFPLEEAFNPEILRLNG